MGAERATGSICLRKGWLVSQFDMHFLLHLPIDKQYLFKNSPIISSFVLYWLHFQHIWTSSHRPEIADSKRRAAVPGLSLTWLNTDLPYNGCKRDPKIFGVAYWIGNVCRIASIWHLFFALAYPEAILFTKLPNIFSYIRCTLCARLINNKYYAVCTVKEIF